MRPLVSNCRLFSKQKILQEWESELLLLGSWQRSVLPPQQLQQQQQVLLTGALWFQQPANSSVGQEKQQRQVQAEQSESSLSS